MNLLASLSLSHSSCHAFIVLWLIFWIMVSQTVMIDNAMTSGHQRLVQIRKKVMDVYGWECILTDDALVKRYSITLDGELVMILNNLVFVHITHSCIH